MHEFDEPVQDSIEPTTEPSTESQESTTDNSTVSQNLEDSGITQPEEVTQEPLDNSQPQNVPDQPDDDLESLRQKLAAANLEILQLKQNAVPPQHPVQKPETQPVAPPQTSPFSINPNEVSNVDFLQGEDHLNCLEDPAKFNALLNKVATVAFNASVAASQERILRQIPSVVETAANQQMQIRDIVGRFYAANPDLVPYKPAVSMAVLQAHNANPSMPMEELLNKAAADTRAVLRIKPGTVPRQRVPAQPVGGGRVGTDRTNRPTSTLTEQEQQILDLLDI